MDFDFNIILVPVTLILGLVWLVDKFWLKQHKRVKAGISKEAEAAHANFIAKKNAYIEALSQHQMYQSEHDGEIDTIVVDDAPMPVKQAEREYREAKRQANLATMIDNSQSTKEHFLVRWAYDYFPVLAVVLIVRSFIVEPFNIPSSSMVPALYTGDFVAVNKYAYGIRLPLTYNKVIDTGNPEHGDVVVFRYPENPKIYYIKRVIGLPGDTVSFDSGNLYINGDAVPTEKTDYTADPALTDNLYKPGSEPGLTSEKAVLKAQSEESYAHYYQEQLGSHAYLRRYLASNFPQSNDTNSSIPSASYNSNWKVTVPDNSYFVMGDNSDRSEDGRFWGFVPDSHLAGKAVYVWMHKKPGLNLPTFSYNRSID